VANERVEPAIEDHWCRDPPCLLACPEDVGPLLGVEGIDVSIMNNVKLKGIFIHPFESRA
jgi:hypothetical protein